MEKWYGHWKIKFRKWDNILHDLLCAAKAEAKEAKISFRKALNRELNSNADLRTKAKAWPRLLLRIIRFSIPKDSRATARTFILEVNR